MLNISRTILRWFKFHLYDNLREFFGLLFKEKSFAVEVTCGTTAS